jgi:hypothetical protein
VVGCDSPSQCGMASPSADRGLRLGRWDEPPRYLIRDRDGAYGAAFIRRIRAMGIRDRPVSVLSPWHLRHVLKSYQKYYNEVTTHLSLQKDAPVRRDVCRTGACVRRRSWAGYTINKFEFEFPTWTVVWARTTMQHQTRPPGCVKVRRQYGQSSIPLSEQTPH